MAKKKFLDRVKEELAQKGFASRSKAARDWLRKKVKEARWSTTAKEGFINLNSRSKVISKMRDIKLGHMYFYFYDPKLKKTLKYYDTMPLVIPIDYKPAKDSATGSDPGFLGLNLHYLPPGTRAQFLDKLYTIISDDRFDDKTKIQLSYAMMKNQKGFFKEAYPCLKWYLIKQFRSRALEVSADEWDLSVFLPFESFEKQPVSTVWKDSLIHSQRFKDM